MTRETKIGLLVGLAFIIVIGILLSDHINTAGDPLQASKTQIYSSVEGGVNTPHSQPPSTDTVVRVDPVVPRNQIKTETESEPRPNTGTTVIDIGPGSDPSRLAAPPARQTQQQVAQGPVLTPDEQGTVQGPVVLSQGNGQGTPNNRQTTPETGTTGNSAINQLVNSARDHQEELVTPGGNQNAVSFPKPLTLVPRPEGRQVVAEENDTVSKFATKYMGANSKANREAIIKANPSVGPDGSKVFAGKTYMIPAPAAGTVQPAAGGNQTVAQAQQPQQQQQPVRLSPQATTPTPAPTATTPNTAMYTVKDNDTLWKIASEQLGSGARYPEIVELNKDVLKGKEAVRANMRLKLPAKAVAANN
jgi:nucleoid-associated protein YgaU